jgi:hypothetical protein
MSEHSDYIVYVDESGDHGLAAINPDYPVFVLSFCIFEKGTYAHGIVPRLIDFKFRHFGHDMVILHERDIRKQEGVFGLLRNKTIRDAFLEQLTSFVAESAFALVAVVIKKRELVNKYQMPKNPYEIAMKFGLERVHAFLDAQGQAGEKETTIVFEKRGNTEDRDLELEFRRVCEGENWKGLHFPFKIKMASKLCNSCGLQLADLTARPIGQQCLNPSGNRAFAALEPKLYARNGSVDGWGLKVFP